MAAATRAHLITLILSDVLGDDLATIGSGPTAPDGTTYADAIQILRRYGIWNKVPPNVRAHLLKGRRGAYPESPKPGARMFRRGKTRLSAIIRLLWTPLPEWRNNADCTRLFSRRPCRGKPAKWPTALARWRVRS